MKVKFSTLLEDAKIIYLHNRGITPKEIKVKMGLQNTMRVYNAIRRYKYGLQNIAKV